MAKATPDKQPSRPRQDVKPFRPAIGTEFAGVQEVDAKTRGFLARLIASSTAAAVAVAGCYSLITGHYLAVIGVWSVAGPIIGALVTYYFGPQRDTG
jgi:hypothetical protein